MKHIQLLIFFIFLSSVILSQAVTENRYPYKGIPITDTRILSLADDFTITTTDGITRNLYNTLDSGKTVFIDLFYTTCYYCQIYAPIIEEIYQNTGAGQEDIEFWGISNNLFDTNWVIDQYKLDYNITNPCAGPWGGGTTAFSIIVDGQNFQGFPTYCVICPDRTLFFDPLYPPTVTGFDPYFEQCEATIGIDDKEPGAVKTGIISIYPNPVKDLLTLDIRSKFNDQLTIEIFNPIGNIVFKSSYKNNNDIQTLSIPVNDLPDGAYFIKMIEKNQLIDTRKVLILR